MVGYKKQVFYIHGGESFLRHSDYIRRLKTIPLWHMESENDQPKKWTHTLADELGDTYQVIMPSMPNRDNAKYGEWKIWFERHFTYLHDGAIIIGCSLGAMFLAKYLTENELPFKTGAIILMAAAVPLPKEDHTDYGDFLIDLGAVSNLTKQHKRVIIMHSEDDFVVPFQHGKMLHQAIPNAEFLVLTDKNHFLTPELPELVDKIKSLG